MFAASAMRKILEGAEKDEWEEGKERCAVARESLLIHLSRCNNIAFAFSARTGISYYIFFLPRPLAHAQLSRG